MSRARAFAPRPLPAQPANPFLEALRPFSAGPVEMVGKNASEWSATQRPVRNVAVIAHVDHGKTSLVDCLLSSSGELGTAALGDRVMDSDQIERERGITILSKCTSFHWGEGDDRVLFNIVDTPGHADFGGEVERVLHMVDAVMLVVCAREGPMPQTRFVLSKALAKGLSPLVVFNKADREDARLGEVESEVLDLLIALDATEEQLDFPHWYASAKEGWACPDAELRERTGIEALLDALRVHVPPPKVLGAGASEPFRMLVSQIGVDPYVGKLALGRVASGTVKPGDAVRAISLEGKIMEEGTVTKMMSRRGMGSIGVEHAEAGDVVELAGLSTPDPTHTICAAVPECTRPLFADPIDPPTLSMAFAVNDSPLAGKEGSKLTSAQLQKRLLQEAIVNVAIDVGQAPPIEGMSEATSVSGRGELQLAVLIENLRREGFELSIGPPRVVFRDGEDGKREEPYEELRLDGETGPSAIPRHAAALSRAGTSRARTTLAPPTSPLSPALPLSRSPRGVRRHADPERVHAQGRDDRVQHRRRRHRAARVQGPLPRPPRLPIRGEDRDQGPRCHEPRLRRVWPVQQGGQPHAQGRPHQLGRRARHVVRHQLY